MEDNENIIYEQKELSGTKLIERLQAYFIR